jgi:hypothetical protein
MNDEEIGEGLHEVIEMMTMMVGSSDYELKSIYILI